MIATIGRFDPYFSFDVSFGDKRFVSIFRVYTVNRIRVN